MNILDALLGEHGVLYAEIDYLEGAHPEATTVAAVQASLALLAAGVQSHSRLEDELLFVSLERHLGGLGLTLHRTKVGDRYVAEKMRASGINVGGEQSGHLILSDFATTGDGLLAALQVLEAFRPLIAHRAHRGTIHRAALSEQVLRAIAVHRVADRPDRFEPRMAKRRPKRYNRLTRPRQEIKRQMIR